MFRILESLVLVALMTPASPAQDRAQPAQPVEQGARSTPVAESSPLLLRSFDLPYHGKGELHVLNGGELILELGGGFGVDEEGEGVIYDSELVSLALDRQTTTLIDAGGQWFLDHNGAMISARGLSPAYLSVISFDAEIPEGETQTSLADFEGEAAVTFDPDTGLYRIEVVDAETQEVFTTAFRLPPRDQAQNAADAQTRATTSSYEGTSSSEGHCESGHCEVTCQSPLHALTWCDGDGSLYCTCKRRSELPELVPDFP